jgi:hypothetical protein
MQPRLRIESALGGSLINEYRINDGEVELRTLDPEFPHRREWRQMSEDEARLHECLNTAVAHWFHAQDAYDNR